uniref:GG16491 n=1 Tax=Drosophila erecta TaxID=7220 RepID=B3P3F7_DROER
MELVTSPYVRGLEKPLSWGLWPPSVLRGFECPLLFCAVCHLSYLNCVSGAGSEARKKIDKIC